MKLYDGFIESMKDDEILIPKKRWNNTNLIKENQEVMDIVPGFPVNKSMPYDEKKMIQAIQNGMILLIKYKGEKDKWRGGRERVISGMVLGKNKNTGNILLRGWHLDGYSVSQKKNTKKVWRLFNVENIRSMQFTGNFIRMAPKGYKMNDRIMTEKTITKADFNTIRRNQEALIRAGKIEKEEEVQIGKKESSIVTQIQIKNTSTVLDLTKPWDNDILKNSKNVPESVKISILKTVFTNDYIAIVGALGEKNKTVKVYEDKKLLGSYKTIAAFTGKEFNKNRNVNNQFEFDLFTFVKKL